MGQGFAYVPDTGRVKWMDGDHRFWSRIIGRISRRPAELAARRCGECGLVEFFVEPRAKPVKTLDTIGEENEHLRLLLRRLQERVATLEAIATDPSVRAAREIESLRERPAPADPET